jgi:hypothetical protein
MMLGAGLSSLCRGGVFVGYGIMRPLFAQRRLWLALRGRFLGRLRREVSLDAMALKLSTYFDLGMAI